jgi:hypothetical protein
MRRRASMKSPGGRKVSSLLTTPTESMSPAMRQARIFEQTNTVHR